MMRLTEAVFINSCQTFISFFSSRVSGIDRGNAVSVFPLGREMEVVTGQGGFLWHTAFPHSRTRAPPSLKWEIQIKKKNKQTKMKAQPRWTQQLGMWSGLTPAVFPVCIQSLFHLLSEATSRATITTVTRGRGRGRDVLRYGVQGHQVLLPASWPLIPQLAHCSGRACRVAPP